MWQKIEVAKMELDKKIAKKAVKEYLKHQNKFGYDDYKMSRLKFLGEYLDGIYTFIYLEKKNNLQEFYLAAQNEQNNSILVGYMSSFFNKNFEFKNGKIKELGNEKHKN